MNPIEKGHPDIIPVEGQSATEAELRNYPQGLEVKVTVGNVITGTKLEAGTARIDKLTGLTWQAHHREVKSLLGLVVDFAGWNWDRGGGRSPIITAAFFAEGLSVADWGEISGTTGRNTKVTGMRLSGKSKMGKGWQIILDSRHYIKKYGSILKFTIE